MRGRLPQDTTEQLESLKGGDVRRTDIRPGYTDRGLGGSKFGARHLSDGDAAVLGYKGRSPKPGCQSETNRTTPSVLLAVPPTSECPVVGQSRVELLQIERSQSHHWRTPRRSQAEFCGFEDHRAA